MTYEEKYIKLLEDQNEELQRQLAIKQTEKDNSISDNDFIVMYIAGDVERMARAPSPYTFSDTKCLEKVYRASLMVKDIIDGKLRVKQKYIDMVKKAMVDEGM